MVFADTAEDLILACSKNSNFMKIKHLLLCGITSWIFVVSLQGESLENGEVVPLEKGSSSSPLMILGKFGEKKATPIIE